MSALDRLIRFSGLVRKGLRFRRQFEDAKQGLGPVDFDWYPYDCFANLFYVQRLLKGAELSWETVAGSKPILDVGAADGALSFFLESLGHTVHACDHSGTNVNRMQGIRILAGALGSHIEIVDVDVDAQVDLRSQYSVALFLGTLYHVKNPFYILEFLADRAQFCFLSTRVAHLQGMAAAYLLEPGECKGDVTNYWIFSPAGLRVLVERAGWKIRAEANSGPTESDPVTTEGDARMFLLLESLRSVA